MTTHRLLSGKAVNGALIGLETRVARLGPQASVPGMPVHTQSTCMALLSQETETDTSANDSLRHSRGAYASERCRW